MACYGEPRAGGPDAHAPALQTVLQTLHVHCTITRVTDRIPQLLQLTQPPLQECTKIFQAQAQPQWQQHPSF